MKKIKSKNLEMLDFTEKLNQKIRYGAVCQRRVIVGSDWGLLWFVICDVVGYWLCLGFNRGREIKAEN